MYIGNYTQKDKNFNNKFDVCDLKKMTIIKTKSLLIYKNIRYIAMLCKNGGQMTRKRKVVPKYKTKS